MRPLLFYATNSERARYLTLVAASKAANEAMHLDIKSYMLTYTIILTYVPGRVSVHLCTCGVAERNWLRGT